MRTARGLYTAPMFGIRSSVGGPGCREPDVMVNRRNRRWWNLFVMRFQTLLKARLYHIEAAKGRGGSHRTELLFEHVVC